MPRNETALNFSEIPRPPRPIVDQADVFSDQEEAVLAQLAVSLKSASGPEIVVWTLPSLRGEAIESLGIRAAETWQLGSRDRDDGLILLIAARERRVRIEVGQGLEGDVPDVVAYRQIQEILVPGLRAQQPAQAVARWISDVGRRTTPGWSPELTELGALEHNKGPSSLWLLTGLVLAVILLRSLPSLLGIRSPWAGGGPWSRGYGRLGRPGGSGGFGGFGGSGGGWGGSGGGFGGGGASGGW